MNMQSCGNKMNLFDSLNSARRLTELAGAVLERSKRYPQRFALKTTPPVPTPSVIPGNWRKVWNI